MVIIFVFHIFKKLSRDIEDIKEDPNQTSRNKNYSV